MLLLSIVIQVLETGLGGRLDATNILTNPALSIITSIGLEHTRILGDTVEQIALEKGGIIKPNRPVLVGPDVPMEVLRQCALEKGASGFYTCDDILGNEMKQHSEIQDYDKVNSRMVKAALQILQKYKLEETSNSTKDSPLSWKRLRPISTQDIESGTQVRPPCRFEIVNVTLNAAGDTILPKANSTTLLDVNNHADISPNQQTVTAVLDVAHNPPAMIYLASKLQESFPNQKFRFVAGFSADKDLRQCTDTMLSVCQQNVDQIHLIQAAHPRAATLEMILDASVPQLREGKYCRLSQIVENEKEDKDKLEDRSITGQLHKALQLATINNEVLIICGSVFIMAEAREALGFEEPKDSDCISEVAGANLRHGQENFGNTTIPMSTT